MSLRVNFDDIKVGDHIIAMSHVDNDGRYEFIDGKVSYRNDKTISLKDVFAISYVLGRRTGNLKHSTVASLNTVQHPFHMYFYNPDTKLPN